jgi:hypothetical protein
LALKYPSYAEKAVFVELLAEGSSHTVPAEPAHLDSWIGTAEMSFSAVIDPPGVGQRIVEQIGPRETALVVELESMKILLRTTNLASAYATLDGL